MNIMVNMKPHLFSSFKKVDELDEFEIYEFIPSLLKAFPFQMEKFSLPYRIRCIQEYFVGYRVFYIRRNGIWGGYCVVSNGKNPRYGFSNADDIIYGRIFVASELRGHGHGVKMLYWVLNLSGLNYVNAYGYVHDGNKASHATLKRIGATPISHFDKVGKFRKIVMNENGKYTLYKYRKTSINLKG